jgi:hypothetical protein
MKKLKLTIELVPAGSWFSNLRTMVSRKEWDRLRKKVYEAAGNLCEICGGKGRRHPVECHERWSYDDDRGIQKLEGLIALCPMCHMVKHYGLAQIRGNEDWAFRHLCKVNEVYSAEGNKIVDDAFEAHRRRSDRYWMVDTSWADQHDVKFLSKHEASIREDKARLRAMT